MPRKANKQVKIGLQANRRLFGGILVVLLFGIVGSAWLLFTQAFPQSLGTATVQSEHPRANNAHTAGESFDLPFTGAFDIASGPPKQVLVQISYAGKRVKPRDPLFVCGPAYKCTRSPVKIQESAYSGVYSSYYVVCLDVPAGYHSAKTIFTVRFKATADLQYGGGWLSYRTAIASGGCASPPTGSVFFGNGEGGCGSEMQYSCQQGPGPGWGGDNPGVSDDGGNNNDGDGDGQGSGSGGGGSGGSTAKTPNDKPNTTPSTSNQGKNKQPDLNPSPFYDGKQYQPGSASDNVVTGAVFSTGRAVANNWPLALVILALASAGGVLYWRKYRK